MAWSDWQPASTQDGTAATAAEVGTGVNIEWGGPHGADPTSTMADLRAQALAWSGATSSWTSARKASVQQQFVDDFGTEGSGATAKRGVGIAFYSTRGWRRPDFPTQLNALEYGVDYVENPDTGDFIEYEDGTFLVQDGDTLRWTFDVDLAVFQAYRNGDVAQHITVSGQVAYRTDDPPPEVSPPDPIIPPITPAPGGGVQVVSVAGTTGDVASGSATILAVRDVSLTTEAFFDLFGDDPNLPTGFLESTVAASCEIALPRWRYWKPDTAKPIPLRQRQRDDGLALASAARWRGSSSRQATNRWRAYT